MGDPVSLDAYRSEPREVQLEREIERLQREQAKLEVWAEKRREIEETRAWMWNVVTVFGLYSYRVFLWVFVGVGIASVMAAGARGILDPHWHAITLGALSGAFCGWIACVAFYESRKKQ